MMAPKITWNIVVALLELLLLVELELFPVTLPVVLLVRLPVTLPVVPVLPGLVGVGVGVGVGAGAGAGAGTVQMSSDSGLVGARVGAVLNFPTGQAVQVSVAL